MDRILFHVCVCVRVWFCEEYPEREFSPVTYHVNGETMETIEREKRLFLPDERARNSSFLFKRLGYAFNRVRDVSPRRFYSRLCPETQNSYVFVKCTLSHKT